MSDTLQCVDVGWTEPPVLPDWIGITVTGVTFTPEGAFAESPETVRGRGSTVPERGLPAHG